MHWKRALTRLVALVAVVTALAACGGNGDTSAQSVTTSKATREAPTRLAGVKDYLVDHTQRLTEFTGRIQADSRRYYRLADASELDYQTLWGRRRSEVAPLVERLKDRGSEVIPYYERVRASSPEHRRSPSSTSFSTPARAPPRIPRAPFPSISRCPTELSSSSPGISSI